MIAKVIRSCTALMLLVLGMVAPASAQQDTGVARPGEPAVVRPSGPIPGQYIVVFKKDVTNSRGLATAMARQSRITLGKVFSFALKGFSGRMPAAVADRLRLDPNVAYIEQEHYAFVNAQSLPTGVDRIEGEMNFGGGGGSAAIAIVDTGIDLDHPDLNVVHGVTCIRRSFFFVFGDCNSPGTGNDDNFHGSHVAGTAAAKDDGNGVVGVAPGFPLWAVKVLDQNGSGSTSTVIAGLDYIAQHAGEVAVANLSLGFGSHQQSVCNALTNLINAGVVPVVSAGNDSASVNNNNSPADCPGVITVSALADFDGLPGGGASPTCRTDEDDSFANFSNYGPDVDIMAPGVCIYSTWKDGGYGTANGTSMSAPHVAGTVARYISALGTRDANVDGQVNGADVAKIKNDLIAAAIPQDDPDCGLSLFDDPDGQAEPIVFANAVLVGGDGSCGGAVPNAAPEVAITSPADGSMFLEGESISFTGTGGDVEDGDLTSSLAWTSSLDGPLGNGGSLSTTLSVGAHTVTASVSDSGGKSGSDAVTLTVESVAQNTPPSVAIIGPADGSTFNEGDTITFTGTADDLEDGDLAANLSWSSDVDGFIGTGESVSSSTLSVDTHLVTAQVTDLDGEPGSASITLTVESTGGGTGGLTVSDISYCARNAFWTFKHLVSIVSIADDSGPLENATVSATITKDGSQTRSGTATTDEFGEARFNWNYASSGSYSTAVNSVNGDTGIDTPSNEVTFPNGAPQCGSLGSTSRLAATRPWLTP